MGKTGTEGAPVRTGLTGQNRRGKPLSCVYLKFKFNWHPVFIYPPFFFGHAPHSMWGLSSLTRDGNCAPCIRARGKS